jgi:hypothetical protein
MATSTLAAMSPQVGDRLQDPTFIFWNEQFEVWAGLAEGINELLLMIGRPTQIFNETITIESNTVWQTMPSGVLALTNLNVNGSQLKKTTLRALDYTQSSWSSAWQSDRAPVPARWAPVGLGMFIVHPAPVQPIFAQATGIAYPFTDTWPPAGTDVSPFEKNLDQALEMYAASYARVKEIGQDFQEGLELYKRFQQIGQRYSVIQDRRDDLVWTQSFGAPTAPSQVYKR